MRAILTEYVNYKDCEKLLHKKVHIVDNSVKRYKCFDIIGDVGTIIKTRCTTCPPCILKSIAVRIDDKYNPASENGLFWISPTDAFIIEGDNDMKETNFLCEGYKLCVVQDTTNGNCNTAAYYGNINIGDLVACDYHYSNGKMSVRQVVDLITGTDSDVCCEVIGKVDDSAYITAKSRDEKRKELIAKMEYRASQIEEHMYYKMLAEHDEEMAELYKAFSKL